MRTMAWFKSFLLIALALLSLPTATARAQIVPPIQVEIAPPPPREERRSIAPSPNHTWIEGHWAWRGGRHAWMPGHWAMAPGAGYVWEQARWVNQGGHWSFYEGHWRMNVAPAPTVVYEPAPPVAQPMVIESEPPPPIAEVRPVSPFGGAVWIPGYWEWHGHHHVWVGGHWSAPRAGFAWEPHRWVRDPGGHWRMEEGHWRRR